MKQTESRLRHDDDKSDSPMRKLGSVNTELAVMDDL